MNYNIGLDMSNKDIDRMRSISAEEFLVLSSIKYDCLDNLISAMPLINIKKALNNLEYHGMIKKTSPKPTLRFDPFLTNETDKEINDDVINDLVDNYLDLFPKGVKNGGYYVRSDKKEVKRKMIKFLNDYDYNVDQILKATKKYIESFEVKGYKYMRNASYFIHKLNTGSELAAQIEQLDDDDYEITGGGIQNI